jgi:choloylglycine hydrolase
MILNEGKSILILGILLIIKACTDFQLKSKDNSIISARSMEYPISLNTHVTVVSRRKEFISQAPYNQSGFHFKTKYGFISMQPVGYGLDNIVIDGMNEKGLSFGLLSLKSKYPEIPKNESEKALTILLSGAWILGCCNSVPDVFNKIDKVKIWSPVLEVIPGKKEEIQMHIVLHDKYGNNGVIEFVNGKTNKYFNIMGVLTNDPELPWHLSYMSSFNQLSNKSPSNSIINDYIINSTSIDNGMMGLPGDWSSISRFVKIAIMLRYVDTPKNANDSLNLALHMLNTVDRPIGTSLLENNLRETTRWIIIRDHTNKLIYWRAYTDLAIRMINLKYLNFNENIICNKLRVQSEYQTIINDTNKLYQT